MMTGNVLLRPLIATVLAVLFNTHSASAACVTDGQGPCYRFWAVESVFIAQIVEMQPLADQGAASANVRTSARVVEAFKGAQSGAIVELFLSPQECPGPRLRVSTELFVYASKNPHGQLWASGCGDTKLLAHAEDDLSYARTVSQSGPAARVFGDVVHKKDLPNGERQVELIAGVMIRVSGVRFRVETLTDANGSYSITVPNEGAYVVEVIAPAGFVSSEDPPQRIDIPDRRACYRVAFELQLDDRSGPPAGSR